MGKFFRHFFRSLALLRLPLDVHHLNGSTGPLGLCSIATTLSGAFDQRWVFLRISDFGFLRPSNMFGLHFFNTCVFRLGFRPMLSGERMLHCYTEIPRCDAPYPMVGLWDNCGCVRSECHCELAIQILGSHGDEHPHRHSRRELKN